jgi:hypothetical protein
VVIFARCLEGTGDSPDRVCTVTAASDLRSGPAPCAVRGFRPLGSESRLEVLDRRPLRELNSLPLEDQFVVLRSPEGSDAGREDLHEPPNPGGRSRGSDPGTSPVPCLERSRPSPRRSSPAHGRGRRPPAPRRERRRTPAQHTWGSRRQPQRDPRQSATPASARRRRAATPTESEGAPHRRRRAFASHQGVGGAPLIRNGTVTMLDATPRSSRSLASMRPSLFRSGTTFGASLKTPS